MGQADDMCITVAWDQAPHWGKKEKKINVGEKKIGERTDIFPVWPRFLLFSQTAEPGPRLALQLLLARLSSGNVDVPDVMISNRKFDISLDGTFLSYTTNLNAFVLGPAARICRDRALK